MQNRALGGAFGSWAEAVERSVVNRERVGQSLRRILHRQLYAAYSSWSEYVEWRRRMAAILSRLLNARLAAALGGWRDATERGAQNREALQKALGCVCVCGARMRACVCE